MQKKGLFLEFDNALEGVKVFLESILPFFRDFVFGIRFPIHKGFGNGEVFFLLQHLDMGCEVSIRNAEHFLERVEVARRVDDEHRHDLQSCPVLEYFIQIFERILHLSYRLYITTP